MTSGENFPELEELTVARSFLDDIYPDAITIVPAVIGDLAIKERMFTAGIGMAEVLLPEGESNLATYVARATPYTQALEMIFSDELDEILPAGSHDKAIDSIIDGEFYEQWGAYLPRNSN